MTPKDRDTAASDPLEMMMEDAPFLVLPAISVPCGFTDEGLPVGVLIVGRQHDDLGVLQLDYAFQQATEHSKRRPKLV